MASPIIYEEIVALVANYRSTMADPGDATSAWVSLSEINALMATNPGATGIRIYYGRHNNDPEYGNKHTVILVATDDTKDQQNPTPEHSRDLLVAGLPTPPAGSAIYTNMGDDRIPLCPPHCPLNPNDHISHV